MSVATLRLTIILLVNLVADATTNTTGNFTHDKPGGEPTEIPWPVFLGVVLLFCVSIIKKKFKSQLKKYLPCCFCSLPNRCCSFCPPKEKCNCCFVSPSEESRTRRVICCCFPVCKHGEYISDHRLDGNDDSPERPRARYKCCCFHCEEYAPNAYPPRRRLCYFRVFCGLLTFLVLYIFFVGNVLMWSQLLAVNPLIDLTRFGANKLWKKATCRVLDVVHVGTYRKSFCQSKILQFTGENRYGECQGSSYDREMCVDRYIYKYLPKYKEFVQ